MHHWRSQLFPTTKLEPHRSDKPRHELIPTRKRFPKQKSCCQPLLPTFLTRVCLYFAFVCANPKVRSYGPVGWRDCVSRLQDFTRPGRQHCQHQVFVEHPHQSWSHEWLQTWWGWMLRATFLQMRLARTCLSCGQLVSCLADRFEQGRRAEAITVLQLNESQCKLVQ